jgi:protein TonB
MHASLAEVFSTAELAEAAGVSEGIVRAAMLRGGVRCLPGTTFIAGADAVQLGREIRSRIPDPGSQIPTSPLPWDLGSGIRDLGSNPWRLSAGIHAALLVTATWFASTPAQSAVVPEPIDPTRLVFLVSPGPGGGGGGGGVRSARRAPRLERRGVEAPAISVPDVAPDPVPAPAPPEPEPLETRTIVAPVVAAAATTRDADTGTPGGGMGEGVGRGIGDGSGGGTGGGPYRPGSGIEPPRLLREVKATYTDEARRRGISGSVVLEIVIRSDGSVGAVTVQRGLGAGLEQRAVDAVRQWRFAPARRLGSPVDVLVEVSVDFTLR